MTHLEAQLQRNGLVGTRTALTVEQELAAMLRKILDRSSGVRDDSTGQPIKHVRVALLDEASELLARHGH